MSKKKVSFMSLVELRGHIVDAASYVVADAPWYVSKIAQASNRSYYAKITAQLGVTTFHNNMAHPDTTQTSHFSNKLPIRGCAMLLRDSVGGLSSNGTENNALA